MIGFILEDPSLRYKVIKIVGFLWFADRGFGVWPSVGVSMHAWGAEMLECVCGDFDELSVVEDEGLGTYTAFGYHGYGGDEAELFVDAGAEVGIAESVEGGRVRPVRRVGRKGREQLVERLLQAALGGKIESKEDKEESYAVGGRFVASKKEDEGVAEYLGSTDCGGYLRSIVVRRQRFAGRNERY